MSIGHPCILCVWGESSHISESCGVALKSPGDGSFQFEEGGRMLSRRANLLDYRVGYSMLNAHLTFDILVMWSLSTYRPSVSLSRGHVEGEH